MPVNGLNNALIPIVSFNYGARQRSRITGVIHFALVLSAAIMAVGTVVFSWPSPALSSVCSTQMPPCWPRVSPPYASLPSPSYAPGCR